MKKSLVQNILGATALIGLFAGPMMTSTYAQDADRRAAGTASRALVFCDGGAQEAIRTNTQTSATLTSSPSFVTIPNTGINGGGSGGTTDLYTVTFSGQASATGGGFWEIQAQVSVNGGSFTDLNPTEENIFHSGNAAQTHTMTWCREINASSTQFRIVWRKVGGGTANVDNYVMRVERSN